jgi:hypothetical protein
LFYFIGSLKGFFIAILKFRSYGVRKTMCVPLAGGCQRPLHGSLRVAFIGLLTFVSRYGPMTRSRFLHMTATIHLAECFNQVSIGNGLLRDVPR